MALTYFVTMILSHVIRDVQASSTGRGGVVNTAAAAALACGMALTLSGCNTPAGVQQSGAPKMLAPEEALIFPPPGGPEVLTVINRNYSNAVQQDVILRSDAVTPGQNYLRVQLFGPQKAEDTGRGGLSESSLRASSISREMRSAFPGVAMSTSAEYLQNNYGAFSYASGRGFGNDACIYGWQQIRSSENARQGFKNLGRINVTLRLCQSGVTVRDLLAVMYNYTITGNYLSTNWNPYGTAQDPDKGLGRPGNPVYPVSGAVPMQPGTQTPIAAPVRARPRPIVTVAPTVAPVVVQPQPPASARPAVVIPSPVAPAAAGSRPADVPPPARRIDTKRVAIPSPGCIAGQANGQTCN